MSDLIRESVHGIGPHFVYFALALIVAMLFVVIYIWITPYHEFALIRDGNAAAAISLGGALVGFSLPLASSYHAFCHHTLFIASKRQTLGLPGAVRVSVKFTFPGPVNWLMNVILCTIRCELRSHIPTSERKRSEYHPLISTWKVVPGRTLEGYATEVI